MNELFREHLEAPRHRPRYGTVEIVITPSFGNIENTPQIWSRAETEPAPHWSDDLSWRLNQPVTLPRFSRHHIPPALAALESTAARASRYDAMKAEDPARFAQAAFMANYTALSIEEAWEQIGRIIEKPRTEWPWRAGPPTPPQQPATQELRQAALAAKAGRGSGPGAGPSWRGRTRNIRYQPK